MLAFASILLMVGLGCLGASPWIVLLGCGLLTWCTLSADVGLSREFSAVGPARVFAMASGTSIFNNLIFAAVAFGVGRGISWLLF